MPSGRRRLRRGPQRANSAHGGAQEIAAGWEQGLAEIQAIHHQGGNDRVRVDGGRADASCYGIAYHCLPKQYSGRWRITSFRYDLKFIDGNGELETGD